MSNGAQSNEASTSSVPVESEDKTLDSTAEAESLDSFVASLQAQLNLTESKLEGAEIENSLQSRLRQQDVECDVLESPEVKNLIKNYQQQMKCLMEQINSMKQKRPDLQLVHRIEILSGFNNSLGQQNLGLSEKLNHAKIEITELKDELAHLQSAHATLQSQFPHCESGRDSEVQSKEYVAMLQDNLACYYALCTSSQSKASEYREKLRSKNDENDELVKQIEVLTRERDQLKMQFDISQRQESNSSAIATNNNNYETEVFLNQREDLVNERDQLNIQLEGVLSSRHHACNVAAIGANNLHSHVGFDTQKLLENCKNEVTELREQNASLDKHIREQELKIQNMVIKLGDYQQQVSQMTEENKQKDKKVDELQRCVDDCKKKLDSKSIDDSSDTNLYKEQLKAFQDDFQAEREEKKRIMMESKRIKNENETLIQELHNRSAQFSSPPAVSYESGGAFPSGVHPTQGFCFPQDHMGYHGQSYPAVRGPHSQDLTTTQSPGGQPHIGSLNSGIANNPDYERSNNVPHSQVRHGVSYPRIHPTNVPPDHFRYPYTYNPPRYARQQGVQPSYNNMHGGFRCPGYPNPNENTRTTTTGPLNPNPQVSPPHDNPQDRRSRRP